MSTPITTISERQRLHRSLGAVITGLSLSPSEGAAPDVAATWVSAQPLGPQALELGALVRAAVGAVVSSGSLPVGSGESMPVLAVRAESVFANLPGVIRINVQRGAHLFTLGLPTAAVVAEGAAAPLSANIATAVTMVVAKSVSMFAVSNEVARGAGATDSLGAQAAGASASCWDGALVAGLPAVATVAATGVTQALLDVAFLSAVDQLESSLGRIPAGTTWVLPKRTCAHLAATRSASGQVAYPGVPASLLGLPIATTSWAGTVGLLLAPGAIVLGNDVLEIERSDQASLEFSSAPSGSSVTPTDTTTVSLWQTNTVAIRAVYSGAFGAASSGVIRVTGLP